MKPFQFTETLEDDFFTPQTELFKIKEGTASKIVLLRAIVGSLSIKHVITDTDFLQEYNYLDFNGASSSASPLERLVNSISTDLTTEEFVAYFANPNFLYQNRKYFDVLLDEFCNFFYHEQKGSHATAFIYVYRILEKVSYAFPMIYAAKSDDFMGSWGLLKEYIGTKGENATVKGELGFFKRFIATAYKDEPLMSSTLVINIVGVGITDEIQEIYFKAFTKICEDEFFSPAETEEPTKLAVKFAEFSSFIVTLRNRFFHLKTDSQANFQSEDILDADSFFGTVNKHAINWLSLVLMEILKFTIDRIPVASPLIDTEQPATAATVISDKDGINGSAEATNVVTEE